jgi:nucleoside-diphosphate-sugar epimerase
VKEIMGLMGDSGDINYEPARPGDVHRHIANCLKAKDVLKFGPIVGFDEGLRKTIDWYENKSFSCQ